THLRTRVAPVRRSSLLSTTHEDRRAPPSHPLAQACGSAHVPQRETRFPRLSVTFGCTAIVQSTAASFTFPMRRDFILHLTLAGDPAGVTHEVYDASQRSMASSVQRGHPS
ncbi:unnamed protein product, partial [Ectocarpus sp. 13 AM-2016]